MKQLFAIDLHDYDEADSVFKRPSARGIILRDDNIALVYSLRDSRRGEPAGCSHTGGSRGNRSDRHSRKYHAIRQCHAPSEEQYCAAHRL